jgi:hypothetical protein
VVESEGDEQGDARSPEQPWIAEKIGVDHEGQADGDGLPPLELSTEAIGSPADHSKNKSSQNVVGVKIEIHSKDILHPALLDCNAVSLLFREAGSNLCGRDSGFSEAADRSVLISFRQAAALRVGDQGVVEVFRFGQVQQGLEDPVDMGGRKQVFTAGDERDVLESVIDDDGEVVGGADVFSCKDDVTKG